MLNQCLCTDFPSSVPLVKTLAALLLLRWSKTILFIRAADHGQIMRIMSWVLVFRMLHYKTFVFDFINASSKGDVFI